MQILAVSDITTTVAPLAHRWQRQKENKLPPSLSVFNIKDFSMMGWREQTMKNSASVFHLWLFEAFSRFQNGSILLVSPGGGGGDTWVFFRWVCAARDSKLAPRSKKKIPLKLILRSRNGPIFYTPF